MKVANGIISTNALCVGCNRCINSCKISGANVCVSCGASHHVKVDDEKCIHCGLCITACTHQARQYSDDTERFFSDLAAGRHIAIALDPSLRLLFPDTLPKVIGQLRALGAGKIYDTSFGADICTWATIAACRERKGTSLISSQCPVVVEMVEKYHPELLNRLLPVLSPLMCLAVYVKKYLHDDSDIACIGPCIARSVEIADCNPAGSVKYSVTCNRLFEYLKERPVPAAGSEPDLASHDLGFLYAVSDGLRENLCYFTGPDFDVFNADYLCSYTESDIERFVISMSRGGRPELINALSSKLGCLGSPVFNGKDFKTDNIAESLQKLRHCISLRSDYGKSPVERLAALDAAFSALDRRDFERCFVDRYHQMPRLPKDVLSHIFTMMHKDTERQRHLDCGFCGYQTCLEMARAVGYGYSQVENCIHYTHDEAMRLSLTDDLSGVSNWNGFKRTVRDLLWNHPDTRFLIVYFDIKHFKMINQLYGFAAGDETLKAVARRAAAFVGGNGACARIMADHFILCVPDSGDTEQRLSAAVQQCGPVGGLDFPISIDLGFYRVTDPAEPVEEMMERARLAQLTIKGSYKMRWAYYDETMRGNALREAWVTRETGKALDTGQFVAYFQPKYNSTSRCIVGAEALARWFHPERGMIPPDEFVPVFEKNGFINQLDACIWKQTCSKMRQWLDQGLPVVPVSVNLSRLDLFDTALPGQLIGMMEQYRLPRRLLRLEITESAYTQVPEQLTAMIQKLRSSGFAVEMDDFGSGYSSLNTLYKMPVDIVKLDMRLIAGSDDSRGRQIIRAVVQMMNLLGLPMVAEGVETAEQVQFLSGLGCCTIQGYYYARPLPAAEFEARLRCGGSV